MLNTAFKDKVIAVTGCCGTVGKELVAQLVSNYGLKRLVGLDNNESELFFQDQIYSEHDNVQFYLLDIRDRNGVTAILDGVDIVFHAAAYKHVMLCEQSPFEAVQTNILGVKNLIDAAKSNNVRRVIFMSSDKAVNPTNVMGTTKLMGERLMSAAATANAHETIFTSTRFGNVLGSRGSVIPLFKKQIEKGGPVTLTDAGMTRFIMSIRQSVQLVIDSANLACGGEVFVTKMPVVNIKDLAEVMIRELAPRYGYDPADVPLEIIGTKPGEKMYEELMNTEETRRTWELENYFAVLPTFRQVFRRVAYDYPGIISKTVEEEYNSAGVDALSSEELLEFLEQNSLLD